MYAVITLRITIFILHLCAESLKNSVLISSKDLSSQIPIVNPRPYWKRWGGGGGGLFNCKRGVGSKEIRR